MELLGAFLELLFMPIVYGLILIFKLVGIPALIIFAIYTIIRWLV